MKRITKNILSFTTIVVLVVALIFTNFNSASSPTMNQGGTPPEMSNSDQGTPPEMPSNNQGTSNAQMSEPPAKPEGESAENGNTPPAKPGGGGTSDSMSASMPKSEMSGSNEVVRYVLCGLESLLLALIIIYLIMSRLNQKTLKETFINTDKKVIFALATILLAAATTNLVSLIAADLTVGGGPNSNMRNTNINYSSPNTITIDTTKSSGEYQSTAANENAALVTGKIKVDLSNMTAKKTGDSDGGDSTSFYGMNSGIIAKDGATLNLKNLTVETDATGANGVFSYGGSATTQNAQGDGTNVNIADSRITTKKDNSGGIMTTGGGIMKANNLTIETAGISSAAIRSDRGGGTVAVDGGTYKTTGQGSPTIYSTADISVKNADLVATASEGIVIEGKNKVSIENTKLTDTNNKLNGQSTTYKNIFLYQSMSGDADSGTSEFSAKDSAIITNQGDSFYVTNTSSKIILSNNTIQNNDPQGNFLRVQKDSWGKSGSNGGTVELSMDNQKALGNIVVDSISTLNMKLNSNSYYEGTINGDNKAKNIELTLDQNSKIKLTGDSYITKLNNSGSSNIDLNGHKLYINGQAYQG